MALAVIVTWAGHYLVFGGYSLSRDEQMAQFATFYLREGMLGMPVPPEWRSEEHTSELQSLMRISYAVFCLKKKKTNKPHNLVSNNLAIYYILQRHMNT